MADEERPEEGVKFWLCADAHLHCSQNISTISAPEQFQALADGLQSQLDTDASERLPVIVYIPCMYSREQVTGMIAQLRSLVMEHKLLNEALVIRESHAGFEG